MKKVILLMMSVVLALTSVFPVSVFAEESGVIVDGVTFSSDMKTLWKYPSDKEGTEYVVPDGVKEISYAAFMRNTNIKNIVLPEGLEVIGENAFYECKSLETINIPYGVTMIPKEAFYGCKSLKSIEIPYGVTHIDWFAFMDCTSLTSVKLPSTLRKIATSAFEGCTILKDINLPNRVEVISDRAFYMCRSLERIVIPKDAIFIGRATFLECESLKEIFIPNTMVYIEQKAFEGCTSLTDVYYGSTELWWSRILGNHQLENATIHYEWVQEDPVLDEEIPEPKDDRIRVTVDGKLVKFPDQEPIIQNDRILVPFRAIFEALGAKVKWDDETKTVHASKGSDEISLELNSEDMLSKGDWMATLDVPVIALNGRVMVPTRAVAEAFYYKVEWDGTTNTVIITEEL